MSDKEILAELKKSYEYLNDIRENGCYDYFNGQLNREMIDKLNIAKNNIEDIYFQFYKTLNKEDLRVESLEDGEKVYIASSVDGDYEVGEDFYNMSGIEVGYYWYEDQDFIYSKRKHHNKYYANLWITENDRDQGYVDEYYKDFNNLKDAIKDLRTYFDDGNCACVEIYDPNEVLQYSCDKNSEEFFLDNLKIVKVDDNIINEYIDYWSKHNKLDLNNNFNDNYKDYWEYEDKKDKFFLKENFLYCKNQDKYIAVDNSSNNCWVEEFDNEESAIKWLIEIEKEKNLEREVI